MAWKSVATSMAGTNHQRAGIPCQDYAACVEIDDGTVVGIVADGAGYARHADVGARVAVETAFACLRQQTWRSELPSDMENHERAQLLLATVQAALLDKSRQVGCELTELASTLLALVATPAYLLAFQLGDGFIVARRADTMSYELLCQPQHGEYANETVFTTSLRAADAIAVRLVAGRQAFVCAATDGLEEVALGYPQQTPFPPFFRSFDDYLQSSGDMQMVEQDLRRFLDSPRLNARTHDDKTLLLCSWSDGEMRGQT